jgi:alkylation response protein AidB-like acyl-CoA dehydrogenase
MYLPKLVSGEWTGTMCLTEPHCGTDLGLLRSKAEPQADGSYKRSPAEDLHLAGEHDLAANIVHLVLARLPDAPAGTKGISLFVVPKFLVERRRQPGARNAVHCGALENKMGIHANATCQMNLGRRRGHPGGRAEQGPAGDVRDDERRAPGRGQPVAGLTEVAYQNAVAYAKERLQMRSLTGPKAPDKPADPIIVHPDVRKMLLTAARLRRRGPCAGGLHRAAARQGAPARRGRAPGGADLVALLTPIVKAFLTDNGWIATSHCMQVFGGHGYIRETGHGAVRARRAHQHDLRGHQHHPVAGPAGPQGAGRQRRQAAQVRQEDRRTSSRRRAREDMQEFVNPLADLGDKVTKLTMELGMKAMGNPTRWAPPRWTTCAWSATWCCLLLGAHGQGRAGQAGAAGDPFYTAKLHTARFYFAKLLPETASLIRSARAGAAAADGDGRSPVLTHTRGRSVVRRRGDTHESKFDLKQLPPSGPPPAGACRRRVARPGHAGGLWKTIDDETKAEKSLVRIVEPAASVTGKVEKILTPTRPTRCDKCTDDRKDQPVQGMTIVTGVKNATASLWDGGEILDPNNGKTYKPADEAGRRRQEARSARLHRRPAAGPHADLAARNEGARHTKETHEPIHRPQGRRARRRRDGRADRRPPGQRTRCRSCCSTCPPRKATKNGDRAAAIDNLKKLNPRRWAMADDAAAHPPGQLRGRPGTAGRCDLVIEAIAERMDWKHDLYRKVAPFVAPHAIFATNTSGLSIGRCRRLPAAHRAALLRRALLQPAALHAPGGADRDADHRSDGLDQLETFLTTTLGKGVVRAKDTPNFIANRIGTPACSRRWPRRRSSA